MNVAELKAAAMIESLRQQVGTYATALAEALGEVAVLKQQLQEALAKPSAEECE